MREKKGRKSPGFTWEREEKEGGKINIDKRVGGKRK